MRAERSGDQTWKPIASTSSLLETLKIGLSTLIVLFCFSIWAYLLARYGVDVPRADQWDTPASQILLYLDGNLTLADVSAQHMESRKVFPNLISIALTEWRGHHDTLAELYVGFGLAVVLTILIGILAWQSFHRVGDAAVVTALFTALFWSVRTGKYHLWSINFERQLPEVALVSILLCFLWWGATWRTVAVVIIGCVIAQYSFAGGIVLWPLSILFLLLFSPEAWRQRYLKGAVLLVAAAASTWLYFGNYQTPYGMSPFVVLDQTLSSCVVFVLTFLGNGVTQDAALALVIGSVGFTIFTGQFFRFAASPPPIEKRAVYGVWFTLGGYVLAQAILATISRLPHGTAHALRDEYVIYPAYFGAAVVALCIFYADGRARQAMSVATVMLALILAVPLLESTFWHHLRLDSQRLRHGKACILLSPHYMDPKCLLAVRVNPNLKLPRSRLERSRHLFGTPMIEDLVVEGKGRGYVDEREVRDGRLRARGWAAQQGEPAAAVVAAVDTPSGLRVLKVGQVIEIRPDVAEKVDEALLFSGWSFDVPVEEEMKACDIQIYSIDTTTGALSSLAFSTPPDC